MKSGSYHDMQILQELDRTPQATQRDLAKRMGVALGLTNLVLRRLVTKGYIKITGTQRNRILYLITPQGLLEKSRLTYEYIEYSLQYYRNVRRFLREHLESLIEQGHKRMLLYGTGELAEIAYLTLQEIGLDLVGIVGEIIHGKTFLNIPVQEPAKVLELNFDRIIIASFQPRERIYQWLLTLGLSDEKIIMIPDKKRPAISQWKDPVLPERRLTSDVGFESFQVVPEKTDVVILCGGRGSRLGSLTAATPKPLLPVGGRPFLLHVLLEMKREGFSRFILATHYLADHFRTFISETHHLIPDIHLIVEPEPLGTGGALRHALGTVSSPTFVVMNGDSLVSQPLRPVIAEHERACRVFTVVAVRASNVDGGAFHKGVWRVGPEGEVEGFATEDSVSEGWVNAGIYVLDRAFVLSWPVGQYSLEGNLPSLLNGKKAGIFCSPAHLVDIGTPQTYERAHTVLGFSEMALPVSSL